MMVSTTAHWWVIKRAIIVINKIFDENSQLLTVSSIKKTIAQKSCEDVISLLANLVKKWLHFGCYWEWKIFLVNWSTTIWELLSGQKSQIIVAVHFITKDITSENNCEKLIVLFFKVTENGVMIVTAKSLKFFFLSKAGHLNGPS